MHILKVTYSSFSLYCLVWHRLCSQNFSWSVSYFKDLLTAAAVVRREQSILKLHAWQTWAKKLRTLGEMRWMNRGRTLSYEISTNKYRNGLTSCKRVYLEMTFVRKELLTFILGGCSFDKNFLKRLKRGYYERQGFNPHILKRMSSHDHLRWIAEEGWNEIQDVECKHFIT